MWCNRDILEWNDMEEYYTAYSLPGEDAFICQANRQGEHEPQ